MTGMRKTRKPVKKDTDLQADLQEIIDAVEDVVREMGTCKDPDQ